VGTKLRGTPGEHDPSFALFLEDRNKDGRARSGGEVLFF
jgi:hypothetical protein